MRRGELWRERSGAVPWAGRMAGDGCGAGDHLFDSPLGGAGEGLLCFVPCRGRFFPPLPSPPLPFPPHEHGKCECECECECAPGGGCSLGARAAHAPSQSPLCVVPEHLPGQIARGFTQTSRREFALRNHAMGPVELREKWSATLHSGPGELAVLEINRTRRSFPCI